MNNTTFCNTCAKNYKWFLVDADSKTLGRLSSEISKLLLGKLDVFYSRGQKAKHAVIVINAEKIVVSGKKEGTKFYVRHSGTPGGLSVEVFNHLKKRNPARILEKSVRGMLPKNTLGRDLFTRLKIYPRSTYPHESQVPVKLDLH